VRRRNLIAFLGATFATWPLAIGAEPAGKVARVGYIGTNREFALGKSIYEAFLDELRKFGFYEGQNLVVEFRSIEQAPPALASDAADLVRSKVDLILTDGTEAALQATVSASPTLPIVMIATNFDPLAHGYVKSLAQPGRNITGVFLRQTELAEKQTELLTQAVPHKVRLAVLWDAISADQFSAAERRGKALGLKIQSLKLEKPPYDFDPAFRILAETSPQMLLVLSSPNFAPFGVHIAELAIRYRFPTMFIFKSYVQAGGLLSYGADYVAMHRQAATYVAKILRGAKPADLPVEQPDKFEMVVNLKTAKALGLTIPQSVLLRADEVIE
jgi:putative tryptophan/tyrosine transport system substrate-binding protein